MQKFQTCTPCFIQMGLFFLNFVQKTVKYGDKWHNYIASNRAVWQDMYAMNGVHTQLQAMFVYFYLFGKLQKFQLAAMVYVRRYTIIQKNNSLHALGGNSKADLIQKRQILWIINMGHSGAINPAEANLAVIFAFSDVILAIFLEWYENCQKSVTLPGLPPFGFVVNIA